MRRLVAVLAIVLALTGVSTLRAHAQSPAPATTETTSADDGGGRPWGRLAIFIPVSVAIGAAAVYGSRYARDRGWLSS